MHRDPTVTPLVPIPFQQIQVKDFTLQDWLGGAVGPVSPGSPAG